MYADTREFVATTVGLGVTAAAGLAAVKGTGRRDDGTPAGSGMEIVVTL